MQSQKWGDPNSAYVENGKFRFDVTISHPVAGLIVRYRGLLTAAVDPD
jgi:hypothetical protein